MLGDLIYKHSITAKVRARAAATAKEPSENTDGDPPQRQPPRRAWQQCAAEGPQSANRQQVSAAILLLIRATPAPHTLRSVPGMVQILEEWLYRTAPSYAAYRDLATLQARLRRASLEIGVKIRRASRHQLETPTVGGLPPRVLARCHRQAVLQQRQQALLAQKRLQQQYQVEHVQQARQPAPGQVLAQLQYQQWAQKAQTPWPQQPQTVPPPLTETISQHVARLYYRPCLPNSGG